MKCTIETFMAKYLNANIVSSSWSRLQRFMRFSKIIWMLKLRHIMFSEEKMNTNWVHKNHSDELMKMI